MYVVKEWNVQDGESKKEFATYTDAKRYFNKTLAYTLHQWAYEGMPEEHIDEWKRECVTKDKVNDHCWGMEIVKG